MNAILGEHTWSLPQLKLGPSKTPTRSKIHPQGEEGEEGESRTPGDASALLIPMVKGI